MKIKELLEYGRNNLIAKEEPIRLSKMLLKGLLKVDDSYLIINQDIEVKKDIKYKFCKGINLLNEGKPIQYITNNQEFMKMNFYVDENVLIPQPDTEILVEEITYICRGRSCACPKKIRILDLCTGSGAIGISLAKYIKDSEIIMMIDQASSPTFFLAECVSSIKNNGRDIVEQGIAMRFYQRLQDLFSELYNDFTDLTIIDKYNNEYL